VNRNDALATTWAAATRGVFVVEFLTNVGELPEHGATFLFAPIKIKGTHGGYGRALAVK
jgi:kynurenine formamidase